MRLPVMARILTMFHYDGAIYKMKRLGLQPLIEELQHLICSTEIRVLEKKREGSISANGAAALRKLIDQGFQGVPGWEEGRSGDVDWIKCKIVNGTRVCIGVEVQVSARDELLYKDILHLRTRIVEGNIDLGVIVVPSARLQSFLPDRTPTISYARQVVKETDADRLPIILIEIEHDGPGPPLGKMETNTSKGRQRRT
jgi:hypothetical protein